MRVLCIAQMQAKQQGRTNDDGEGLADAISAAVPLSIVEVAKGGRCSLDERCARESAKLQDSVW